MLVEQVEVEVEVVMAEEVVVADVEVVEVDLPGSELLRRPQR